MSKISTIFENGEKKLKFWVGPTSESPGPMLLIVAVTAVKFVVKSWLSMEMQSTDSAKITQ